MHLSWTLTQVEFGQFYPRVAISVDDSYLWGFDSAISQWGTEGLNREGTLKHSYPDDKWVLVPLCHWNWKWNQARGNYSTYEQELLAGMLVLSSQARMLGSNPVV